MIHLVSVVIVLVAQEAAHVSQQAAAPAATTPANLLAGPSIDVRSAAAKSIVKPGFDGTLEDVGAEPDYTAIGMLELTDEQRNWYDSVHLERLSVFDKIVRSNYGLILELATLQGETDQERRLDVLARTREAFAAYIGRGSFADEMKEHLTAEQRQEARGMVDTYKRAKAMELRRTMGADATPQQIATRARLEFFGRMIRESIERQVGLERDNFERIARELELSPEQKSKAEAIFQPLAVKRFQGIDTSADRIAAFAAFHKILSPEQYRKALAIYARNLKPVDKSGEGASDDPTLMESTESAASQPSMP